MVYIVCICLQGQADITLVSADFAHGGKYPHDDHLYYL